MGEDIGFGRPAASPSLASRVSDSGPATPSRHTPGPWRLFLTPDGRKTIGIGEPSGTGIVDCGFGTWRSGDEQLANARLITAAPDLLEALKRAEAALRILSEEIGAILPKSAGACAADAAVCRAAIAKATSEGVATTPDDTREASKRDSARATEPKGES